jgi:hypothetical protein
VIGTLRPGRAKDLRTGSTPKHIPRIGARKDKELRVLKMMTKKGGRIGRGPEMTNEEAAPGGTASLWMVGAKGFQAPLNLCLAACFKSSSPRPDRR